uniref:Transcriptional regulator n=1 Tax=Heterorhabditis bacteriophora TaxID=37862 RepID=A0A1I7WYQ0_HETBA
MRGFSQDVESPSPNIESRRILLTREDIMIANLIHRMKTTVEVAVKE